MRTGIVCYVERTVGGANIRRLRLVGPELDQTWTAPRSDPDSGAKPAAGEPGQGEAIRAAAEWLADELSPERELAAICIDSEGAVCSWLSTPSTETNVVMAALRQAHPTAALPGEATGAAGGFGLLPDEQMGFGDARSVQALAAPTPREQGTSLLRLGGKTAAPAVGNRARVRVGVLSAADAPVRVLLDELDRLKIQVNAVVSQWHAAGLAWDPSVQARSRDRHHPGGRHVGAEAGHENGVAGVDRQPIIVEAPSGVAAVVLVDPSGRLTWSWSSDGELLAAGAMRLRTHSFTRGGHRATTAPAAAPVTLGTDSGILDAELLASAPSAASDESVETVKATECATNDVGRLVMDWLAWSAQLSRTPDRIIVVGPRTVPGKPPGTEVMGMGGAPAAPEPEPADFRTIGEMLAAAWPDASVDVAVHDDPVGATLNRLRALPEFSPAKASAKMMAPERSDEDPRIGLVALATRPGRADRKLYLWAAMAILGAAAAIFLFTRRLNSTVDEARARLAAVQAQREDLLKRADEIVPGISKGPDPFGQLNGRLQEYGEKQKELRVETPILPHIVALVQLLKDEKYKELRISKITVNTGSLLTVDIDVPKTEKAPTELLEALKTATGAAWDMDQSQGERESQGGEKRRPYPFTLNLAPVGGPK